MQSHCRDCQVLIESQLISEPHYSLKALLEKPEAQIYQCTDCESCFIFTRQDISLVMLDEQKPQHQPVKSESLLQTA